MMASPSELSLDCKPHNHVMLLKSLGDQQIIDQSNQTQKLEDFLSRLEEERLKIDAFKRELPLCMQLLNNAVETSRQQLLSCRENQGGIRPVLEEFIPIKNGNHEESENTTTNMSDKANWMISAQLWSQASDGNGTKQQQQSSTTKLGLDNNNDDNNNNNNNKHRINGSGAFLPFSKERNSSSSTSPSQNPNNFIVLPELALASSDDHHKEILEDKKIEIENGNNNNNGVVMAIDHHHGKLGGNNCQAECQSTITSINNNATNNNNANTTQAQRKARRCWSPDLHRRFVNALQMLGGSQATPKQIRELMKVDGLTNDEVKSHLQKYRLHTRRPSPSPQAAAAATPQLVVLGGIWVPQEYATAAHGGATATLYGAHHPSTHASQHYCATPVPQEFYQAPTPVPQQPHHQLHHQFLHHQLHVYKPPSQTTHGSPGGGNGDRSESIEDGKSESSSWKADSGGENGGERMTLALREEGEESNGSEITLKF